MTDLTINTTKVYGWTLKAYNDGSELIINQGGTGSGKTYAILQVLVTIALRSLKPLRISVVSETMPHLKKGAMRDFFDIIGPMYRPEMHNRTDHIYAINNTKIEFFPADNDDKLRGARRDILFINEANNIKRGAFDQLEPRTRKCTFIDFNPTHWFYAHDLMESDNAIFFKSTYKDNPYIGAKIKRSIESRKERDPNWWRVYGLGEIGMTEGLVFSNWQQVESFPEEATWWCGMDFGYTNDPSTIIRVAVDGEAMYMDELLYRTGMTNPQLARFCTDNIAEHTEVFADSAEPKSIDEIYAYGVNIHPATKGQDSVKNGIDVMHRYDLKVTKRSTNMIKELRNYTWMKDKNGDMINKPVDLFNHAIDAARYAITMKCSTQLDSGWVV